MNQQIYELAQQAAEHALLNPLDVNLQCEAEEYDTVTIPKQFIDKFTELLIEECRAVVTDVYRKTPLEACGYLLAADEEIAKHFYGETK